MVSRHVNSGVVLGLVVAALGLVWAAPVQGYELNPKEGVTQLLLWDFDASGPLTNPFNATTTTGGTSARVEWPAGNHVMDFTDTNGGTVANLGSLFLGPVTGSDPAVARINEILAQPVGSDPVDLIFQLDVERALASTAHVGFTVGIEFNGASRPTRFPMVPGELNLKPLADYDSDGVLELVDNLDFPAPAYRFTITPTGGANSITNFQFRVGQRVDTAGTPETAYADSFALYEVITVPEPASAIVLALSCLLAIGRRRQRN